MSMPGNPYSGTSGLPWLCAYGLLIATFWHINTMLGGWFLDHGMLTRAVGWIWEQRPALELLEALVALVPLAAIYAYPIPTKSLLLNPRFLVVWGISVALIGTLVVVFLGWILPPFSWTVFRCNSHAATVYESCMLWARDFHANLP